MARIFTADGVVIAKVMRDHINTWTKKPCVVTLETIDKGSPSMMLQQLASAEKVKQYIDGSYIGAWNFAVYVRVHGIDTASRLDAIAVLDELSEWLTAKGSEGNYIRLPQIDTNHIATSIEMSNTPSIAARYEDGTEDYQAVFRLEYKYKRRT